MDSFARLPASDRSEIIQERARQMDIDFTIVEKDFWVCWTLKSLFTLPPGNAGMTFKGGTSLSKAYGLITRFSEDIDVVTDPAFFFAQGLSDPGEPGISKTQRTKRMDQLDKACAAYLADRLLSTLRANFAARLGSTDGWKVEVDTDDPNALLLHYPKSDPNREDPYIRSVVKIELGWRAKTAPSELRIVTPYVADIPMMLQESQIVCSVLAPNRTFWEKVTALHAESFRQKAKQFFSRHYSDVATMLQTQIGQLASRDFDMLEDVRVFKDVYYHTPWARYDLAKPGSLVVVPGPERLRELAVDYRGMQQMFLSEPPAFNLIIRQLRAFEYAVNA
jgi:hypothetical protein